MAEPVIVDDYESEYDNDDVLKVEKNRDEAWINLKTKQEEIVDYL